MASRTDLAAMRHKLSILEEAMSHATPEMDAVLSRYGDLQNSYEHSGGYDLEERAREALGGLGIDRSLQRRHPSEMSGGQQRRVELAKLLLAEADLLLIDEPDHLDLEGIEWLEEFMSGVGTAFVLVSHDRRFLDRVCTAVLELSHGRGEEYPGDSPSTCACARSATSGGARNTTNNRLTSGTRRSSSAATAPASGPGRQGAGRPSSTASPGFRRRSRTAGRGCTSRLLPRPRSPSRRPTSSSVATAPCCACRP